MYLPVEAIGIVPEPPNTMGQKKKRIESGAPVNLLLGKGVGGLMVVLFVFLFPLWFRVKI